jgi:hypothetical protein
MPTDKRHVLQSRKGANVTTLPTIKGKTQYEVQRETLELAAPKWLPIETAPKDVEIWAFNGEQARMTWSAGEGWALWIWADSLLSEVDPEPTQPTHWMPLPAAPTHEEMNHG